MERSRLSVRSCSQRWSLPLGMLALGLFEACHGAATTDGPKSASMTPGASTSALAATASEPVAFEGVTLIDGTGAPPIERAVLLVQGGVVLAAGPAASVPIPVDARRIPSDGKTIIPGLVSDHSHVGVVDGMEAGASFQNRANILRQLRQYEVYGVTTVTSLGLGGEVFTQLRAEMHAAKNPGADLFGVDRGIGVPNGAPPAAMLPVGPDQLFRPSTPEEARDAVRAMVSRKTDFVKIWLDDFGGSLPVEMKPEIYRAIIDEAHAHGVRVAAHIHDLDDAKAVVAAGADVLAHGVRDKPVDAEFVAALKARNVWYVPTLSLDESTYVYAERPAWTTEPFVEHALQPAVRARIEDSGWRERTQKDPKVAAAKTSLAMNLKNLATLRDAGVAIGFGTDSGATPLRVPGAAEHRELALMVQAGIPPVEALHIATERAATLLGLSDRGTLTAGKRADFIVLDSNPAKDIANTTSIYSVWHRGRLASGRVATFTP